MLDAFRDGGDLYGDAFAFAVASAGLQVLRPGTGDQERLSGTAGGDLYLIAPRGGQEITISSGEGKDTLRFGEWIGLSDISLEKSGYNGIGMNAEEIEENLETIARSRARSFLEATKDQGAGAVNDLIEQFGVGFYAAFMVAESIDVISRSYS